MNYLLKLDNQTELGELPLNQNWLQPLMAMALNVQKYFNLNSQNIKNDMVLVPYAGNSQGANSIYTGYTVAMFCGTAQNASNEVTTITQMAYVDSGGNLNYPSIEIPQDSGDLVVCGLVKENFLEFIEWTFNAETNLNGYFLLIRFSFE